MKVRINISISNSQHHPEAKKEILRAIDLNEEFSHLLLNKLCDVYFINEWGYEEVQSRLYTTRGLLITLSITSNPDGGVVE